MNVYITVGTTSFDPLVQALDSIPVATLLKESGYTSIKMQIGRGEYEPNLLSTAQDDLGIEFSYYRFKPSIHEDMMSADLVISHAGAGSIMETLRLNKALIVVVNQALMDNHQIELAQAMQEANYLRFCYVSGLISELKANSTRPLSSFLKPYPAVDYNIFPTMVDKQMGFS